MSATCLKENSDLIVIRVSGLLTDQDQKNVEKFGRETIDRSGKVKVLIVAEGFSGWAKQGDWGDVTFMLEYDPFIEKIAVVADERWRDEWVTFLGTGLREAAVMYFHPDKENDARAWLI